MKAMVLALLLTALLAAQPAGLLLRNGKVWTGEEITTAVAIRGNRIAATGPAALRLSARRTIDLKGRLALPGFNDAHIHFLDGALGLTRLDLTGICTLPAIQKAIADYAQAHPTAPWITGGGWEYTCFPNLRMPTKEDIDAVVSDRPVFLDAYDGHSGWANSKALRIGEVESTPFSGFGEVVKGADGKPTGFLKEAAKRLVSRHIPETARAEQLAALEAGLRLAARLGITSIQNAARGAADIEVFEQYRKTKKLTLRASFALSANGKTDFASLLALREKYKGPDLAIRSVKFFLDGVIESHTAAMLENYSDGTNSPGPTALEPADFAAAVRLADKAGWQIYTHAIGDRAVRLSLDAYEAARQANGTRDSRHRIEHIEVIHSDDVPRFARLGVLPVMQPIHAYPSTVEVWSRAVGEKRLPLSFPWASIAQTGARLTFSSDWPASISLDPIRGIHNAVNRMTIDGKPPGGWLPAQRVSLEAALRAYTQAGAYASFEEGIKGKLLPGMLADIVVLSGDPFALPAPDLHQLKVDHTIFDGQIIYSRN
ncbi:MAG: amidohydrolase [Acidobacteriota bacterium]